MNEVIRGENLGFCYQDLQVFHHLNMEIEKGEFAAIIGSNGAGKSTFLKILLGELLPCEGSISLMGTEVSRFQDWHKIGYVPQNGLYLARNFPATVREVVTANLFSQIGLMGFLKKHHKEKVVASLEAVGMAEFADCLVGNLSGGQQQRVMLARALVNDPILMILDEPTTGVDVKAAAGLYELLHRMNQAEELTILMVTHEIARLTDYVSKVFCLEEGSMVRLDPQELQEELTHRHKHPTADGGCCHGHA